MRSVFYPHQGVLVSAFQGQIPLGFSLLKKLVSRRVPLPLPLPPPLVHPVRTFLPPLPSLPPNSDPGQTPAILQQPNRQGTTHVASTSGGGWPERARRAPSSTRGVGFGTRKTCCDGRGRGTRLDCRRHTATAVAALLLMLARKRRAGGTEEAAGDVSCKFPSRRTREC